MSSPVSRPDHPDGEVETRRGDDASEGRSARSASSEGSDIAEGPPSEVTSTTGQDATGVEARDASPDASAGSSRTR